MTKARFIEICQECRVPERYIEAFWEEALRLYPQGNVPETISQPLSLVAEAMKLGPETLREVNRVVKIQIDQLLASRN